MRVSLIITTYNWPESLKLVLKSIESQKMAPDEVIVADDGSSVETKELVCEFQKDSNLNLVHSWQEDKGFRVAKSRNQAIAISKGDYIILVDGDMILHSNFVYDHIKNAQSNYFVQGTRVFLTKEKSIGDKKYSFNQFLFDSAFLLGLSGALQSIITPDFENINNIIGVICFQLQHSLIILNVIWLMSAYNYRLKFKGVCLTYLLINFIAPIALLINNYLGQNSVGASANYFYVNELPKVDNYFLNFVSQHPSPDFILYIQPIFIIYFTSLYIPFFILNKIKNKISK